MQKLKHQLKIKHNITELIIQYHMWPINQPPDSHKEYAKKKVHLMCLQQFSSASWLEWTPPQNIRLGFLASAKIPKFIWILSAERPESKVSILPETLFNDLFPSQQILKKILPIRAKYVSLFWSLKLLVFDTPRRKGFSPFKTLRDSQETTPIIGRAFYFGLKSTTYLQSKPSTATVKAAFSGQIGD